MGVSKWESAYFFIQRVWPRYREQGKFSPQSQQIWGMETESLLNSEEKNIRKYYHTCPEISHSVFSSTQSHSLKKSNVVRNYRQAIDHPWVLDTLACKNKGHKTNKRPDLQGKRWKEPAIYTLLPRVISRLQTSHVWGGKSEEEK